MPRTNTAAKRYAEAIAGIAREAGTWEQWRQDLAAISKALEDPTLRLTLLSPRVSAERKQQMLDQAIQGNVSEQAHNLLLAMGRRGRFALLPDVAVWFDELANRSLGIRHFIVTSAAPLTDQERQQLTQRLKGNTGQVVLEEQVNPDIIGGLVIRHEDVIRDYSVRAQLESLRERLN